ncbi:hypothetical protein JCM8547_008960 [Rhodosporidiobolus lusitaniae]
MLRLSVQDSEYRTSARAHLDDLKKRLRSTRPRTIKRGNEKRDRVDKMWKEALGQLRARVSVLKEKVAVWREDLRGLRAEAEKRRKRVGEGKKVPAIESDQSES